MAEPESTSVKPPMPGIAAGLLAVAGGAAFVAVPITLVIGWLPLFPFVLAVTLFIALLIGMPIFLLIRRIGRANLLTVAAGGFVTGAFFPALLILPGSAADQASVGGVATVIDGHYTAAGWMQNLTLIGSFGGLGIVGALAAWLLVGMVAPKAGGRRLNLHRAGALALLLIVTAAGSAVVPSAMIDRSCHNPLRGGGTSAPQIASFELQVPMREWPAFRSELERFAEAQGWDIRADVRPDIDFPWFQASLCTEPGTLISVNRSFEPDSFSIGAFQPQGGDGWRVPFEALRHRLEKRWPRKARRP